jgi:serine/threonine protein kinase
MSEMNETQGQGERHPVELLSEEFSERLRRGESPSIDDYVQQYPEHSALIRSIFPSLMLVERVSAATRDSSVGGSDRSSNVGNERVNLGADRSAGAVGSELSSVELPESFGDFEVIRRIGSGGMGVVYEAIQRSLQRHVALKVMNAIASEKPQNKMRFRREAESAAGLHHTNIVPVFGLGEDHGLQYYAMQLIEGISLHEVIESVVCMTNRSLQKRSANSNNGGRVDSVSTGGSGTKGMHGIGQWKQSSVIQPRLTSVR